MTESPIRPNEPNPYRALERVLSLRPSESRKLLRLVVWCEDAKCTPLRVFSVRDGQLVQCRSDADVRDLQEQYPHLEDWSRRRAFFLDKWLVPENPRDSRLQIVCDCQQTRARLIDVRKLASLVPSDGAKTRHVNLREVVASEA